jgi:hypothetical protein
VENVGAYAINKGTYTYGTNYDETYVCKDLTITQLPVSANSGQSKVYGAVNPVYTYTSTQQLEQF